MKKYPKIKIKKLATNLKKSSLESFFIDDVLLAVKERKRHMEDAKIKKG